MISRWRIWLPATSHSCNNASSVTKQYNLVSPKVRWCSVSGNVTTGLPLSGHPTELNLSIQTSHDSMPEPSVLRASGTLHPVKSMKPHSRNSNTSVRQSKHQWIRHVLRHDGLLHMTLLKAEWKVNQQEGEEEFNCYKIWQMMVTLLHSDGQLRTERDGDTEKGCQKPAVQQNTTADELQRLSGRPMGNDHNL